MIADVYCHSCGTLNLVHLGDMSDLTVPDVDGFKCWSCGKTSPLDDDETFRELHMLDKDASIQEFLEDEGFIADGEPRHGVDPTKNKTPMRMAFVYMSDHDAVGNVIAIVSWDEKAKWFGIIWKTEGLPAEEKPFAKLVKTKIKSWIRSGELPCQTAKIYPWQEQWWDLVRALLNQRVRLSKSSQVVPMT